MDNDTIKHIRANLGRRYDVHWITDSGEYRRTLGTLADVTDAEIELSFRRHPSGRIPWSRICYLEPASQR